ncbi:hypothetical protein J1605_020882, partial [Eschrichtius robustus]
RAGQSHSTPQSERVPGLGPQGRSRVPSGFLPLAPSNPASRGGRGLLRPQTPPRPGSAPRPVAPGRQGVELGGWNRAARDRAPQPGARQPVGACREVRGE